jgi:hypothetical protein
VLRVLPGTVVVDPAGTPEILADSTGTLFGKLLEALPSDLAGEVSAQLVQVRIRNAGQVGLTGVTVTFPDNQRIGFGDLPAGAASRYAAVALAYRYALVVATADGTEHRWQPIDFMGETPLAPGHYSYAISVDGDQIELLFEADDGPVTPSQAEPSPVETPDVPLPTPAGDTATWRLLHPAGVGPRTTELAVGVTRLGCASGATGSVLDPVVEVGGAQVVITIEVEPLPDGPYECQGNETIEYVVNLPEPLGDRDLVDGACLAGEAVGTAACGDGAVRRLG